MSTPTTTSPAPVQPVTEGFPEELLSSALFLLKRLGMRAKEQSFVAYEQAGLHPYHHAILAVLDKGSRETQGAIADALGYDKGQLVGLLDELEERGLIARQRDQADRRRHVVEMTPAGRKTLAGARRLSARLEDEFLGSLDEEERKQLHALLVRLAGQHLPHCRQAAMRQTLG
ncbi:MAG TPA: MarR family winged helix-turn-helix transcriptional regulator [Gaiellaceae bacterium]